MTWRAMSGRPEAAAWSDPALRRALCASALHLLKILLASPDVDAGSAGPAATEGSLGSLGRDKYTMSKQSGHKCQIRE